jgi:hypothetical protein
LLYERGNRHIAQHHQWMIRSYAVTFTFISVRALNFIPACLNMSDQAENITIIVMTAVSAYVLPDVVFHWHDLRRLTDTESFQTNRSCDLAHVRYSLPVILS